MGFKSAFLPYADKARVAARGQSRDRPDLHGRVPGGLRPPPDELLSMRRSPARRARRAPRAARRGPRQLRPARRSADSIRYAVTIADVNRVGLTETNYGFFGNNFVSRTRVVRVPARLGLRAHVARRAVGGRAGALRTPVSSPASRPAIVDNAQGTSAVTETEFTPAGNAIVERSRIANSNASTRRDAISDQDLDLLVLGPAGARSVGTPDRARHTPLDILVAQRTLGFSLPAGRGLRGRCASQIINHGPPLQRRSTLGLYAQLVSGNKNAYSAWPPSSARRPGSWYYKVLRRLRHDRAGSTRSATARRRPIPAGCNFATVPARGRGQAARGATRARSPSKHREPQLVVLRPRRHDARHRPAAATRS